MSYANLRRTPEQAVVVVVEHLETLDKKCRLSVTRKGYNTCCTMNFSNHAMRTINFTSVGKVV